ncbi:MAG: hypothetical protein AABW89_01715 [Nanoarchaeota archaeon]
MNRKGHIGTALMPFLFLVLIVNALIVMYGFSSEVDKTKAQIRALIGESYAGHENILNWVNKSVTESLLVADKNDFEDSFNLSFKKLADEKRGSELNTNMYAKIALGEYSLFKDGDKYIINVKDVFESSNVEYNGVKYSYSLTVLFDDSKVLDIKVD